MIDSQLTQQLQVLVLDTLQLLSQLLLHHAQDLKK